MIWTRCCPKSTASAWWRYVRRQALGVLLDTIKACCPAPGRRATEPRGQWSLEQFDDLIGQNKRDFDTRFAKSRVLIAMGEWPAALDELLEIIMRDKKWADEAPRKTYIGLLELMTPPQPKADPAAAGKSAGGIELAGQSVVQEDPQAQMVSQYRRKLSMALN